MSKREEETFRELVRKLYVLQASIQVFKKEKKRSADYNFTQEEKDVVKDIYHNGLYTKAALGRILGIGYKTLEGMIFHDPHERKLKARRLFEPDVTSVRIRYATGEHTQRELAIEYNTSLTNIRNIIHEIGVYGNKDEYLPEFKKVEDDDERFETSYIIDENGCWVWNGLFSGPNRTMGVVRAVNGKQTYAHIFSHNKYNMNDPITDEKPQLLHMCGNKKCVNPEHLRAATIQEVRAFSVDGYMGSNNSNAELNEIEVLEIRRLYSTGTNSMIELAGIFNVHRSLINKIVRRKLWRHI